MGTGVIIHGYIESLGFGGQKESKRVYRHNKAVINSLPDTTDDWPFFSKRMFSVLPLKNSYDVNLPQHDSLIISFGASYKNMYVLESQWVYKFESLLRRLCWIEAVVFNEYVNFKYIWKADNDEVKKNFLRDPPLPTKKWTLKYFKCDYESIQEDIAVNGKK